MSVDYSVMLTEKKTQSQVLSSHFEQMSSNFKGWRVFMVYRFSKENNPYKNNIKIYLYKRAVFKMDMKLQFLEKANYV